MYNVCRSLFVLVLLTIVLYKCMSFVNLQILITPLVPASVSYDDGVIETTPDKTFDCTRESITSDINKES